MFLRQKEHSGEVADLSDRVEDAKIGQVVDHRGMMMEAEVGYLGGDKQKDDENGGPERLQAVGHRPRVRPVRPRDASGSPGDPRLTAMAPKDVGKGDTLR